LKNVATITWTFGIITVAFTDGNIAIFIFYPSTKIIRFNRITLLYDCALSLLVRYLSNVYGLWRCRWTCTYYFLRHFLSTACAFAHKSGFIQQKMLPKFSSPCLSFVTDSESAVPLRQVMLAFSWILFWSFRSLVYDFTGGAWCPRHVAISHWQGFQSDTSVAQHIVFCCMLSNS